MVWSTEHATLTFVGLPSIAIHANTQYQTQFENFVEN